MEKYFKTIKPVKTHYEFLMEVDFRQMDIGQPIDEERLNEMLNNFVKSLHTHVSEKGNLRMKITIEEKY